ncbi:MAG: sugar phosphate nucleotidyltransferase [Acidobacteriota bacterium]
MRALVLAAGFGARLAPLTLFRAKPAIPFLNRPIIHYSLEMLQKAGIDQVVVNLHHLPDSVRRAVRDAFPRVRYSFEPQILGTGGAIAKVRDFLREDDFVVCNGKIYFEEELRKALAFHRESGAVATMVLVPFDQNPGFNPVYISSDRRVCGFGPGYQPQPDDTPWVFTGVHILSPQLLDRIPDGPSDSVRDLYAQLVCERKKVNGFVSQAYWCETSTPERYLEKSFEVLRRKGRDDENIAADSSRVHPKAEVRHSIIWDDVTIGERANLNRVIAVGNITVPAGAQFGNAILTPLPDVYPGGLQGVLQNRGGRLAGELVVWPL